VIGVFDIAAWVRWVHSATSQKERAARSERVKRHLFPEGLDDVEKMRREDLVKDIDDWGDDPSEWSSTIPTDSKPPPGSTTTPDEVVKPRAPPTREECPPLEWEGLIPPSSKAHRRASYHDGTHDQTQRMRELAQGSPFDADEDDRPMALVPKSKKRAPQK
jgi:hypothetical protein